MAGPPSSAAPDWGVVLRALPTPPGTTSRYPGLGPFSAVQKPLNTPIRYCGYLVENLYHLKMSARDPLAKEPRAKRGTMPLFTFPVQLTYNSSGSPGVNTWHARLTGENFDDQASMNSIIGWVHEFYETLSGFFPPSMDVDFLGTAKSIAEDPEFIGGLTPWHVDGDATSNVMLPPANQVCINWLTASAGRSGRGRTFIGPIAVGALDTAGDGTPFADTLDQLVDAGLALIDHSLGFTNGAVGVWSPTDQVLRDFTGCRVLKKFAILSSRRD